MLDQIQHEIRDQTSAQAQQEAKQKLTWRAFQEAEQEAALLPRPVIRHPLTLSAQTLPWKG